MKRIEMKTLEAADGSPAIEYASVLREVVRRPLNAQAGIQISEMRQSLRVLDAIDASNGTLELEDADFAHLKTKIEAMSWNLVDRRILQLVEDVTNA